MQISYRYNFQMPSLVVSKRIGIEFVIFDLINTISMYFIYYLNLLII